MMVYALMLLALLPAWFMGTILVERRKKGWSWINKDSRTMYVDAMKTVASSCTIAASLVSAVMSTSPIQRPATVALTAKFAVVCLVVSIVFSVLTVFALSRAYERARSSLAQTEEYKYAMTVQGKVDLEQGRLSDFDFWCIIGSVYVALTGFLFGFFLLARMIFLV